jgi:integrase
MSSSGDLRRNPLWASSIAPSTLAAYTSNVRRFIAYTGLTEQELLRRSPARIDRKLAAYVAHLHAAGDSYSYATQAVYGLIFFHPHLHALLPVTRRCVKGWERTRSHRSYPPITWELTLLLSLCLAKRGEHAMAVACLLAFDGYLRVREYLRLEYRDVARMSDPRLGAAHTNMAIRLARAKTGVNQWVSVRDPSVMAALADYLDSRKWQPDKRVFPFGASRWRRCIADVCASLGVTDVRIVPHSFRHGGATRDYLRGYTIEQIMLHGRWRSMSSAQRYIQQGPAMLLLNTMPAGLVDTARTLEPYLPECLEYLRSTVPAAAAYTVRFR